MAIHVDDAARASPRTSSAAFERFSRGDPARGGDGTGLGLAIVEAIARAHRGSAHAANRDGAGADVWIELPAQPRGSGFHGRFIPSPYNGRRINEKEHHQMHWSRKT